MEYVLEIVEGPAAGKQIPITGPMEIGRDPDVDVPILEDELVSRHHARLTPQADGVRVEDLDSRNGTFVDGDQIFSPAHLAMEGQLQVGTTVFQLRTAAEAMSRTATRVVPRSLTAVRPMAAPVMAEPEVEKPAPAAEQPDAAGTDDGKVPALSRPAAEPTYVPSTALHDVEPYGGLRPLLDTHTKSKARAAPIGLFVLAVFVVILYLALR